MVVCKFFNEGSCRFGQNCKFEHIYAGSQRNQSDNTSGPYSTQQIWKMIEQEMATIENGSQWPLTCFAPLKEGPCYPGWEDISPEEVRWQLYQARQNNTVDQCLAQINLLYKKAELKRQELKKPTQEIFNTIEMLSKSKLPSNQRSGPSIFGGAAASNPQPNVFGGSLSSFKFEVPTGSSSSFPSQKQGNNIFSQNLFQSQPNTSSIFPSSTNLFQSNQSTSSNIFQSAPAQNVFQNPPSSTGNIFQAPPNASATIFQTASNSANLFQPTVQPSVFYTPSTSENIFTLPPISNQTLVSNTFQATSNPFERATAEQQKDPANTFQTTSNPFERATAEQQKDPANYTKLEELTEEEKEQFMAPRFIFGKIPLRPPPLECCFKS